MADAMQRREELKAVWEQARTCTRCPQLASTRTTVVFGSGNADANLMFVGEEIDHCQEYLFRQLELIEPRVVCTLGNFATKLLRSDPGTGITRLHGRDEIRVLGPRAVRLYPIYHPAAALYTPSMLETLRGDFSRLPELLALPAPDQPEPEPDPEPVVLPEPEIVAQVAAPPQREPDQLGLF
jgi:uracil-DNA glycosylase